LRVTFTTNTMKMPFLLPKIAIPILGQHRVILNLY
jgi:hypothetical protein